MDRAMGSRFKLQTKFGSKDEIICNFAFERMCY